MLNDEPQKPGGPGEFQTAHDPGFLAAGASARFGGRTFPGRVRAGGVFQCLQINEAERLAAEPDRKPMIADPKAAGETVSVSVGRQSAGELSGSAGLTLRQHG